MSALTEYLSEKRRLVDAVLDGCLPAAEQEPCAVHACMRYAVEGGKRLRPLLALATAEMLGCPDERILPTCAAIEMIHTHSLILDDMPCMDDDDRRRGRPAAHLAFGEAVALLAADALLNLAIAILADNHRTAGVPPETALAVIREVGEAVGTAGMIGGQAGDLEFAGGGPIATLERIHLGKTARLFRLSARAAALVAGAGAEDVEAAGAYGDSLGLAFQIVDDVLDARGSDGRRGARPEPSYAGAYGASVARDLARQATERALAALAPFGTHADILRALAQTNLERQE